MPYGVDDHQNLLDMRSYLIPQQNRYFGFFGNLSTPENYGHMGNGTVPGTDGNVRVVGGDDEVIINNITNVRDNPNLVQDEWQ